MRSVTADFLFKSNHYVQKKNTKRWAVEKDAYLQKCRGVQSTSVMREENMNAKKPRVLWMK